MEKRKTVYCEVGFIHEFLTSQPRCIQLGEESMELFDNWIEIYKFLSRSDIVLNINLDEYKQKVLTSQDNRSKGSTDAEDQWWSDINKKSFDGVCSIECVANSFPILAKGQNHSLSCRELDSMFLTTLSDETCRESSKNYGVFVLNNHLIKRCSHLFKDNGTTIKEGESCGWDFIKDFNKCFPNISSNNSMIIVDPYLLCDDKTQDHEDVTISYNTKIENNIKPLLKCLLPQELEDGVDYEISVFVKSDGADYEERYNYLHSTIKKIRQRLNFSLKVYGTLNNSTFIFHDRTIITNNVWISCGRGFCIFDNNRKTSKSTYVSIVFPFLQSKITWCDNAYLNLIKDSYTVSSSYHENGKNCWGEGNGNRIIEYYVNEKEGKSQNVFYKHTIKKTWTYDCMKGVKYK